MTSLDITNSTDSLDLQDDFEVFTPSKSFCNLIDEIQFAENLKRYEKLYEKLKSLQIESSTCKDFHSYYVFITTIDFVDSIIVKDLKEYNNKLEKFLKDYTLTNSSSKQLILTCKNVLRRFLPM